jgi:hypothetical protein
MGQTAEPNIDALLLAEQERLNKRKEELEIELSQLNARLGKINRYFSDEALQPFKLTPPKPPGDRRERGAVQEQVKAAIFSHPEGISSGELTKALEGISPQSIQNALSALRKNNQIIKDGARGGKFRPITIEPTPLAEVPTAPNQPSS